jgi:hypothetical protein
MQPNRFQVEVVCHQRLLYHVDAENAASAERLAAHRWKKGESSDVPGFQWCQLESATATELPDQIVQVQDEALLLRFIGERERLLMRLGGNLLSASVNDAISASQVAGDLSWFRKTTNQTNEVDSVRAAQALERLCAKKRLVCFERDRVRAGERGTIRLYCTPDYLEQLSDSLQGIQATV